MNEKRAFLRSVLDMDGRYTGIALTRRNIAWIGAAAVFLFGGNLLPFGPETPKAGWAVGIIASDLVLMLSGIIGCGGSGAYICAAGMLTGLLEASSVTGGSVLFQFAGFSMIGYGIEVTPLGQRLAYWSLKTFGQSPKRIVLVFLTVSAVMSSFLSNTATVILMSALCHQIMQQMGEKPGNSRFAAACMLACVIGAIIGCCGFIQGSIGIHVLAIEQIAVTTQGAFIITPLQWSMIGWIELLILLPLTGMILLKWIPFDPKEVHLLPAEQYRKRLEEVGPIGGEEIRWALLVAAVIVCMFFGVPTTTLMMLGVILLLFPGVGIMDARTAFGKAVPWEVVFCGVTLSFLGNIISNSGLTAILSAWLQPLLKDHPPFLIMLMLALLIAALSMYTIGTTYANIAIGITMTAPVIESLGFHPALILFPVILSVNYMMGYFAAPIIAPNYQYGYWKRGQITVIGTITALCAVMVNCLVTYFLAPVLWGVSVYL